MLRSTAGGIIQNDKERKKPSVSWKFTGWFDYNVVFTGLLREWKIRN
uniref:Uncharacterized protein n=1 Tax=Physcomitrium patens TaxID=3218 RepID=A0A2K1J9P3_PHYPA|nr:hypothetical protein PHYPA_021359 [Physcomitrium patens]